jgi:hypothetical protein
LKAYNTQIPDDFTSFEDIDLINSLEPVSKNSFISECNVSFNIVNYSQGVISKIVNEKSDTGYRKTKKFDFNLKRLKKEENISKMKAIYKEDNATDFMILSHLSSKRKFYTVEKFDKILRLLIRITIN